jgi:hypothetical protein
LWDRVKSIVITSFVSSFFEVSVHFAIVLHLMVVLPVVAGFCDEELGSSEDEKEN